MKKLVLLAVLLTSNVAYAEKDYSAPTVETTVAWFDCQDMGVDAGRGKRGIERATAVFEVHWDCLRGLGFLINFDRCPYRIENMGSGVPSPYCWEKGKRR
jgi:hypothetical protein